MTDSSCDGPAAASGSLGAVAIEWAEVRLLALPLVEPFRAAHGTMTTRELTVVALHTDQGTGWGECSALPEPTYTQEFALDAFERLHRDVLPSLVGQPSPAGTPPAFMGAETMPMAAAALEMALLDAALKAGRRSLADHLGVNPTVRSVPAGAAVGLGSEAEVVTSVARQVAAGYRRVKLKIEPGHDLAVVTAVLAAVDGVNQASGMRGVEVQVDGNGSFGAKHIGLLAELADTGVTAIEQPFAPADLDAAATLVAQSPVPIVADEAAPDLAAVQRLVAAGAASGVSIKPPRVGGLVAARAIHDHCRDQGLATTAGGMIECGLGRRSLAAVAALDGFTVTGDLSPAARWLTADPWPDVTLHEGHIEVPRTPGVAPEPDPGLLDRLTVRRAEVRADAHSPG